MINKEINNSENKIERSKIEKVAELYPRVFAGPPWNEAVKCNSCNTFQGEPVSPESSCACGGVYKEAYPLQETFNYIFKDSAKPGFRIATAEVEGEIVAFSWSYLTTPADLALSKWSTPNFQATVVELLGQQGLSPNSQIRYLNETGVDPRYRESGLASDLRSQVSGPEITVARTNCYSPMTAINYKQGYTQIMGPKMFVDRQQRVIFPTGEVANFLDQENSDRVLFIKYSK